MWIFDVDLGHEVWFDVAGPKGYVGSHRAGDLQELVIDVAWDPRYVTVVPMMFLLMVGMIAQIIGYWY